MNSLVHRTRWGALVTAWLAAIVLAVGAVSASICVLAQPQVFEAYYSAQHVPMYRTDARSIVRWVWSTDSVTELNGQLRSGKMTRRELHHFGDVQRLFHALPLVLAGATLAAVLLTLLMRGDVLWFRAAATRSMVLLCVVSTGAVMLAAWDWKVFFAWAHYPLFGPTSWRLGNLSYTLQLFPAAFWKLSGGLGLLLAASLLGAPAAAAHALAARNRTLQELERTRARENVGRLMCPAVPEQAGQARRL